MNGHTIRLTSVVPYYTQQLITRQWHHKPEQVDFLGGGVEVPVADLCNKSMGGG